MSAPAGNGRRSHRRRGDELLRAIYAAVLAEMADVGFGQLAMGRIADRAGTGKMPLYRRWSSPQELALAALRDALSGLASDAGVPDSGSLRDDLLLLLDQMRGLMDGPLGPAMIAVLSERDRSPEVMAAVHERAFGVHPRIQAVLERGAERGEVDPRRITPHLCLAAPALLIVHQLVHGSPPEDDELAAIVDDVVLAAACRTTSST